MRVSARGLGRLLVSLTLLAGLSAGSASAAPPEGCVGFPSIPEAFVCITQFSPTNAVPSVSQGSGQTLVIPEFCAFECVGPTPVTLPNVVVTPGNGVVAVVTYDGATYPVVVPSAGTVADTVAQAQQAIAGALATALTTAGNAKQQADAAVANARTTAEAAVANARTTAEAAVASARATAEALAAQAQQDAADALGDLATTNTPGGVVVLNGDATINCFGCGVSTGTLAGTMTGEADGVAVEAPVAGWYTNNEPAGPTCLVTGSASGWISGPSIGVTFNLTRIGTLMLVSTTGSMTGAGVGTFIVDSIGNPCGGPVTASITLALTGL